MWSKKGSVKFYTGMVVGLLLSGVVAWAQPAVEISVGLSPAGSFSARSVVVKGTAVQQGPDRYQASNVIFQLDSLKSGIDLRDRHMREKYFETAKFPTAVLVQGTASAGKFEGVLQLRNIRKKVVGTYSTSGREIVGHFKCKMSDFNMRSARYMGVGADDEVEVSVTLPVATAARNVASTSGH